MLLVMTMKERMKPSVRHLLIFVVALLMIGLIPVIRHAIHPNRYITNDEPILKVSIPFMDGNEANEKTLSIPRGTKVQLRQSEDTESKIRYEGEDFWISNEHLSDSLKECVDTDVVYVRHMVNLRDKKEGKLLDTIAEKGEKLEVVSVDADDLDVSTGIVNWYQVKKNGKEYWIPGKYVESTEQLANKNYGESIEFSTYWDTYYGDGYSKKAYVDTIDYKPMKKVIYEDNPLPDNVNALHVTLDNLINNKERLLNIKKECGINAFVVQLKDDDGILYYDSNTVKQYLKNPERALSPGAISYEQLEKLFKEYQKHGYYMIARIVTFKDKIFASENPKDSYTDPEGNLILHSDQYWPSPYSRKAWQYNVSIAKELAAFVNEIQFDYVRFPDGTLQNTLDGNADFHNKYNESKTSVIQGFLMYAKDELSKEHVYIAADIFAWPIVSKDDQDIGQFLPAVANVVDVICPMPYTDHFSRGAMGIDDPTAESKETLYRFTNITSLQLQEIQYPAQYRTWIRGYFNDANDVKNQIEGIMDAGHQGYMLWHPNGNWNEIEHLIPGLIDVKKEDK